jgi:hypothetical protein
MGSCGDRSKASGEGRRPGKGQVKYSPREPPLGVLQFRPTSCPGPGRAIFDLSLVSRPEKGQVKWFPAGNGFLRGQVKYRS